MCPSKRQAEVLHSVMQNVSLLRNKVVTGVVSEDRVMLSEPSTPVTGVLIRRHVEPQRECHTGRELPGVTEEEIGMVHVQGK